jgi:hypothetical protein
MLLEGIAVARLSRKERKYHFRLLEKWVAFLFGVAFGAVKPFFTWDFVRILTLGTREPGDLQQGDLIETCALRMCLLELRLALLLKI